MDQLNNKGDNMKLSSSKPSTKEVLSSISGRTASTKRRIFKGK